jgi:acetyl-CoA C-acetyltransferase
MNQVYIVSMGRSPIGSLGGALAPLSVTQLGAQVAKAVVQRSGIDVGHIDEVILGNVIGANVGQAPAQQVAVFAGLPNTVPCTTINKVCASGMKAIMFAAQSIANGTNHVVLCGGMESMSNIPYYLDKARDGYRLGHGAVVDGIIKDGLWDPYQNYHMGNAAEVCAKEYNITREMQDAYAIKSYERANNAYQNNKFEKEMVAIEIPQRSGEPLIIKEDEEYKKLKADKVPTLKPAFAKDGTITAVNASKINDGAAMLMLVSEAKMNELGLKPLAKILAYADASQAPEWFTTTPAKALPKALSMANLSIEDIDLFEINEAFSVVNIANNQLLKLDEKKVNIYGGAVSLGHPIGCSGARIVCTLISALTNEGGKHGAAAICNGGGGASAIVIEKM